MVITRTASTSVSGSTASATRALSSAWRDAQDRYDRSPPCWASDQALAWSTTNRSRRHESRVRCCVAATSSIRRSAMIMASTSAGVRVRSLACSARRYASASATGCSASPSGVVANTRR